MRRLALLGGEPVRRQPFPSWPEHGQPEEDAILRVTRSGSWWWIAGEEVPRFEAAFAEMQGARFGICVTSGTSALRIALWAAGVGKGDEVIVPDYTFLATATAVVECNATPVFVDIHPDTFCLDPAMVDRAITPRTKAIVPVHFAGRAADMRTLLEVAARHKLVVIEDAAHAHGGQWKGRGLGSLGHAGCFSFQASKNLNCGEGGIILTNDEGLAEECRAIHNFGRRPGSAWYEHNLMSSNYRMTEFQGAILNAQLARLPQQTAQREANAAALTERLKDIPGIQPQSRAAEETTKAYHLYLFRFDEDLWGVRRRDLVRAMEAEGIPMSEGYQVPLHKQAIFAEHNFGPYEPPTTDYRKTACHVTEKMCSGGAAWMLHTVLLGLERDVQDIADAFEKVWEHRGSLVDATVG